jgi:hypothetical protein
MANEHSQYLIVSSMQQYRHRRLSRSNLPQTNPDLGFRRFTFGIRKLRNKGIAAFAPSFGEIGAY